MPQSDFKQVFNLINRKNENMCEESGGVVHCYRCSRETLEQDYLPLLITLNLETSIRVLPRYYLEYDSKRQRCMVLIKGIAGDLDHWVLGDTLLKTFYLVFDLTNSRVGLTTNELTLGPLHEDLLYNPEASRMDFKPYILIGLFVVLALVTVACLIKLLLRAKNSEEESQ